MTEQPAMTAEDKEQKEKWETEEDMRVVQRMSEIMKDPERMKRAHGTMKDVMKVFSSYQNMK